MERKRHPLIAHGELYCEPIIGKRFGGGTKKIPHEYFEAKQRIISDLDEISDAIQEQREIFLEEKIICVRLEPKFEAKSYVPTQLLIDDTIHFVGGRKYSVVDEADEQQEAKLYFIRTDDGGIRKMRDTLSYGSKDGIEAWRNQLGSIHSMDLLSPEEKVMGFPDSWEAGTVEIVLHPLQDELARMLELFHETSKIPSHNTRIKTYEDGLTFISAYCGRQELDRLKFLNPLRAMHPLGRVTITPVRMLSDGNAPQPPVVDKKSTIKVGVFDGGVNCSVPLLNGFVDATECVTTSPDTDGLTHGTAVCGVVLHGNLAGKSKVDSLPVPSVCVESLRVLPILDQYDPELYEAIDAIERIVPLRKDIKLYNLSFGPCGAIVDDSINRFTYALDRLTYETADETNPLFCVAVGNDGALESPLNRIQSPSDIVNGLGVGAYTYSDDGAKIRASYSCIGQGREGAKIKPDLLDFGGSMERPFVLVSTEPNQLATGSGTSFAAPLAVHKIGKIMAQSEDIVPHIGRTLLVHNATVGEAFSQEEQGYGFSIEEADDILTCEDNTVTILYAGTLLPSQTVHLPIFSPKINSVSGIVQISWTITTIVSPYANDPDAYTNNCIEDVFIPHSMTFIFSKRDQRTGRILKSKKLNLLNPAHAEQVTSLIDEGYTCSDFPASRPVKCFWDESDLRANDFKWDTVIKKQERLRGSSLLDPKLSLHAIERNGNVRDSMKYYAAVTIEAPTYSGSLYDTVLQTYQNLAPIEIRNINRIMVDVR